MGNKKNIDRLFQEQFKNFEVSPNDAIWENIQSKLEEDRKRNKKVPIWMKISGIAASLLLLVAISVTFLSTDDIKNKIVDVSEDENSIIKNVSNTDTKESASEIIVNKKRTTPLVYLNSNDLKNELLEKESSAFKNKQLGGSEIMGSSVVNSGGVKVNENPQLNKGTFVKNDTDVANNNTNSILKESSFDKNSNVLRNVAVVQNSTLLKTEKKISELNTINPDGVNVYDNSQLNKDASIKHGTEVTNNITKSMVKESSFNKNSNVLRNVAAVQNSTLLKTENKLSELSVSDEGKIKENRQIANNKVGFDEGNNQFNSSNRTDKVMAKKFKDGIETIGNNKLSNIDNNNNNNGKENPSDDNNENTNLVTGNVTDLELIENDSNNIDSKSLVTSSGSELDKEKSNEVEDSEEQEQPVEKTIEEAVAELKIEEDKNKDDDDEEDIAFNKWKIAPNIAPVYYNSLSGGSPIDSQLAANKKKGQLTTSYGLGVGYAVNKRLTIRTGLNKVELGYDTQDVAINSSPETSGGPRIKNINLTPGAESLNIVSSTNFSVAQIPSSFSSLFDSSLNQRFGYLEVPLELSYKVSDKKMKINVIAGVSTFFLNKNEIYTETNGKTTFIGEANNLNKMSYSTNFGFGFNYKIAKAFNFNFEPMFKYQLNAFSNDSGNFKPYILGVYSGFSYKF